MMARLMGCLPAKIDPIRLANDCVRLEGSVPCTSLKRLVGMYDTCSPEVDVDLRFERGLDGLSHMWGTVHGGFSVVCQRCLRPFDLRIKAVADAVWITPGASSEGIPEQHEVLVADGSVALGTLAEEELLLVWPMFPTHENPECAPMAAESGPAASASFAVLGSLKDARGED
ncbi:MAG: YceD family protein [Acidiferrobacteraceae bacterium]